ncbi:hypothetical protein GYMLUDRAFT_65972 [Collybiopsis luxurians FD-317 M1]|nr:hypothetical protein GYMLUDRAFT_65972 [Collybiopsis luxurians FD-317 M1]
MDDKPYTTPDEDPFNARPMIQPRRRRSSMLDKWIQEQQKLPSSPSTSDSSSGHPLGNPYLAYPDLEPTHEGRNLRGSAVTLGSFELVDDTDIPKDSEVPLPPSTPPSTARKSFRGLNIPFRSQSPARSITPTSGTTPLTPRKPFLPLGSPLGTSSQRSTSKQHNRSTSLSILNSSPSAMSESSPVSSKWRPSVLGYFSSSATSQVSVIPSETLYTPSRPSVSSNTTFTTTATSTSATATAMDNDIPAKPFLSNGVSSLRLRQRSFQNLSCTVSAMTTENNVPAVRTSASKHASLRIPLAPKAGIRLSNSNVDSDDEESTAPAAAIPKPNTKSEVVFKSSTLSKMSFATLSSKSSKKKRLIISGIAPNDVRKFDGVKKWCEGFGEVTHIVRMPNGDLHVHFRSADVADTVCRLRAKVYIVGCGSVGVSWTTGNKR